MISERVAGVHVPLRWHVVSSYPLAFERKPEYMVWSQTAAVSQASQ
ncbi:hypothetical protein ACWKW6_30040 [Dyadobacter jiangsuensis]